MPIEFTLMCHGLSHEEARALFDAQPGVEVQFRDDDWRVLVTVSPMAFLT